MVAEKEKVEAVEEVKPEPKTQQRSTTKTKPTAPKTKTGPLIYVGPNLQGGGLSQFIVFRTGLTPHVQSLIEKQPDIEKLIVPLEKMAVALARSRQPGTLEHTAFEKLRKGVN